MDESTLDAVVRVLQNCRSLLFVTGAGISADSGVPTYRGIGGLYDVDVTEEGYPIEEVLSGAMLRDNPQLTWKYLAQIAAAAHGATFNRAHAVIAEMEHHFDRVWTLTQNVDGFHSLAGSHNVIEIHGNMHSVSCTRCGVRQRLKAENQMAMPPVCENCRKIMRPDVVLFGESLPADALATLRQQLEQGFSAVFSVGTTSVFPYIQEPVIRARKQGVPTVEINPEVTMVTDHVDYHLRTGAAAALDEIWRRFQA